MIVKTMYRYSYQGPIYKNGAVYKLLNEPLWTEAANDTEAYKNFVFRVTKAFGNGTSIKQSAIHRHVEPINYDEKFTSVSQVAEHFSPEVTEEEAMPAIKSKKKKKAESEDTADESNN